MDPRRAKTPSGVPTHPAILRHLDALESRLQKVQNALSVEDSITGAIEGNLRDGVHAIWPDAGRIETNGAAWWGILAGVRRQYPPLANLVKQRLRAYPPFVDLERTPTARAEARHWRRRTEDLFLERPTLHEKISGETVLPAVLKLKDLLNRIAARQPTPTETLRILTALRDICAVAAVQDGFMARTRYCVEWRDLAACEAIFDALAKPRAVLRRKIIGVAEGRVRLDKVMVIHRPSRAEIQVLASDPIHSVMVPAVAEGNLHATLAAMATLYRRQDNPALARQVQRSSRRLQQLAAEALSNPDNRECFYKMGQALERIDTPIAMHRRFLDAAALSMKLPAFEPHRVDPGVETQ